MALQQFLVCARFDDLAGVEHHNQVRVRGRQRAAAEEQDGSRPGLGPQVPDDRPFRVDIQAGQDVVEDQKWIGRAKGLLMDELGLKEHEAFTWIQKSAMRERVKMREIARRVIDDGLRPEPT